MLYLKYFIYLFRPQTTISSPSEPPIVREFSTIMRRICWKGGHIRIEVQRGAMNQLVFKGKDMKYFVLFVRIAYMQIWFRHHLQGGNGRCWLSKGIVKHFAIWRHFNLPPSSQSLVDSSLGVWQIASNFICINVLYWLLYVCCRSYGNLDTGKFNGH